MHPNSPLYTIHVLFVDQFLLGEKSYIHTVYIREQDLGRETGIGKTPASCRVKHAPCQICFMFVCTSKLTVLHCFFYHFSLPFLSLDLFLYIGPSLFWRVCGSVKGHANMLKTLLQHLDGIDDDVIVRMKVPRATPMVYELGEDMKPLRSPDPDTLLSAELLSVNGAPAGSVLAAAAGEVNAF